MPAPRTNLPLPFKALRLWLAMLCLAVACGAFRELALTPRLGDTLARAVCSVFLCLAFLWILRRFVAANGIHSTGQLVCLGLCWALLTLAFEFGLGLARGLPLEALLADYDVTRGRLWPLVPLTLLCGPFIARRLLL